MLKSTHRSGGLHPSTSLPEGWTEHKAPSGHTYYYNKTTKQSTYTRPTLESADPAQDEEPLFAEETGPDPVMQAALRVQEDFFARNNAQHAQPGHFTGGKSYQQRPRRGHGGDRPKRKAAIPDCTPWLLVTTKFGRRFVHNIETKQSLWKFPQDVMMAVITMDRVEWEKKQKKDDQPANEAATNGHAQKDTDGDKPPQVEPTVEGHSYDSSEYEEVEVTDDEDESAPKRPRLSASPNPANAVPSGPAELTEDDIAYQLAAMEAEDQYSDDDQYQYSNPENEEIEGQDEEEGLPMTESDNLALFRSLLDSTQTSPYTTFDSLLILPHLVEDPRWVSLPNMSSRREAFTAWSRDRVAELAALKQQSAEEDADPADTDPKVQYLAFLAENASTKLYWPEFKRKFKKEAIMKAYEPPEKEREKLYREFVGKLKSVPDVAKRRRELGELLKGAEKEGERVPLKVKRDVRYWVVGERERTEVVSAWLG